MEEARKDFKVLLKTEVEKTIKYFNDQLEEERRTHVNEQERLLESLCKAYIKLEEMKVSTTSVHMTVQYYQVLLLVAYHKPFE
jgi:hypothetical protein